MKTLATIFASIFATASIFAATPITLDDIVGDNATNTVTAGSTTTTVYNIEWRMRPEYYPFAVTNVYTNIFVNGINQR